MAYTTINKSTDYFNTKLYTGNGSTQSITGVGFQPDWVWTKQRSGTEHHNSNDAVRGATKVIFPNLTNAEQTVSNLITNFISDGFSVGDNAGANNNGSAYVSWNWKANGQGSSNTDGSINTTYTSVNTTAGFSISKFTGTGSTATVGHGLGVVPACMIFKRITTSGQQWTMYHKSLGNTAHILLNTTGSKTIQTNYWNDTSPTNTVWTMGNQDEVNPNGSEVICYAFAEKTGYSKFGSYTGNGSTDGTFVYTGFKPAFVILKRTNSTGNWQLLDNKRLGYNVENRTIYPNSNIAEQDEDDADLLSNGFKLKSTGGDSNISGGQYIYMAFGQSLVGSNNVPCTAR